MPHTTKQYYGFNGILTAIACMFSGVTFFFCIFYFHLPRVFSVIITFFVFMLFAFEKSHISLTETHIEIKRKPVVLPFFLATKSIMTRDVQSWNVFDMDRGNKYKNQHYKLRLTTFDQKNYMFGLYLHEGLNDFLNVMETILPNRKLETVCDLRIIQKREAIVRLRFLLGITLSICSILLIIFMFVYALST